MAYGSEKPATRRQGWIVSMAILLAAVGIPLLIALWILLGWWTLVVIALIGVIGFVVWLIYW